jgi:hypothetical protein
MLAVKQQAEKVRRPKHRLDNVVFIKETTLALRWRRRMK